MEKKHVGSAFDDFLREEDLLEVSQATAAERVTAFQIVREMERSEAQERGKRSTALS